MTDEANQLLALALKKVDLRHGFSPEELGAKIGLTKLQANAAARDLANAGVLTIGFDLSAEFSDDYRKVRTPIVAKAAKAATRKTRPAKAAALKA